MTSPFVWQSLTGSVLVQIGGTTSGYAYVGAANAIRYSLDYDVVALRLSTPVPATVATPWRVITQHPVSGQGTINNELDALVAAAAARGFSADFWNFGWGGTNQWEPVRNITAANGATPQWIQCLSTEPGSTDCMVLAGSTANELHQYHFVNGEGAGTDTLVSTGIAAVQNAMSCTSWGPGRIDCYWNQANGAAGVEMRHAAVTTGAAWAFSTQISNAPLLLRGVPSCTSWGLNRIDCFSVAFADKRLLHMWYQVGGGQGYEVFNDYTGIVGNPASTAPMAGRLQAVVITGTNSAQAVRLRTWNGSVWSWTTVGTNMGFTGDPAIGSFANTKTIVIGRLSSGQLRSRFQAVMGGSWGAWGTVDGQTSMHTPACARMHNSDGINCAVASDNFIGSAFKVIGFSGSTPAWDTNYYTQIGGAYNGVRPSLVPWWSGTDKRWAIHNIETLSRLTMRRFENNGWAAGPVATRLQSAPVLPAAETVTDMVFVSGSGAQGSHTNGGDSGGPLALRLAGTTVQYAIVGVLQGTTAWSDANPDGTGAFDRYTPTFISFQKPTATALNLSQWFASFQADGAVVGPIP